jgi:hypothetical protein
MIELESEPVVDLYSKRGEFALLRGSYNRHAQAVSLKTRRMNKLSWVPFIHSTSRYAVTAVGHARKQKDQRIDVTVLAAHEVKQRHHHERIRTTITRERQDKEGALVTLPLGGQERRLINHLASYRMRKEKLAAVFVNPSDLSCSRQKNYEMFGRGRKGKESIEKCQLVQDERSASRIKRDDTQLRTERCPLA